MWWQGLGSPCTPGYTTNITIRKFAPALTKKRAPTLTKGRASTFTIRVIPRLLQVTTIAGTIPSLMLIRYTGGMYAAYLVYAFTGGVFAAVTGPNVKAVLM